MRDGLTVRVLNWLSGWRRDKDGFIVRALRESDPDLSDRSDMGFTEEACIAVRTHAHAREVDRGAVRSTYAASREE